MVSSSIADRVKLLDNAPERWAQAYKQSIEEWNDRNQFAAEDYDVSFEMTPLQSRIEALRQQGLYS